MTSVPSVPSVPSDADSGARESAAAGSPVDSAARVLTDTACPHVTLDSRVSFLRSKRLTLPEISAALERVLDIDDAERARLLAVARRAPVAPPPTPDLSSSSSSSSLHLPPPLPKLIDAGPLEAFQRKYYSEQKAAQAQAQAQARQLTLSLPPENSAALATNAPRGGSFLRALLLAVAASTGVCYSAASILNFFAPSLFEKWVCRLRAIAAGSQEPKPQQQEQQEQREQQERTQLHNSLESLRTRVAEMEKSMTDAITGVVVAQTQLEKLISQVNERVQELDATANDIKIAVAGVPEFLSDHRAKFRRVELDSPCANQPFQTLGYDEDDSISDVEEALRQLDSAKELTAAAGLANEDSPHDKAEQQTAVPTDTEVEGESTITELSFRLGVPNPAAG